MDHDDTTTSSLTLEALLAAAAALTPAERQRHLDYAIAADLGLRAQELAVAYRETGDLAGARHCYRIAADYDVPGAAEALDEVEALVRAAAGDSRE